MPLLSPWARPNHVDHAVTDQTSILRSIEDNRLRGQWIGQGSFDIRAGSLDGLFEFRHPHSRRLFLHVDSGQPRLLAPWLEGDDNVSGRHRHG